MKLGIGLVGVVAALLSAAPAHAQAGEGIGGAAAPAAATVADSSARPAVRGPLRLEVSVSDKVLRVYQGDEVLQSYPVAVGQPQFPTPEGSFSIQRLIWNPRWVPPAAKWARGKRPREPGDPRNPMGRVKMFFREPDYYIHGTNDEASLGKAASHGCVRMANEDVVSLAKLVMEHGGETRPPDWFHRVVNYVRSTREVRLSQPVPVQIVP